MPTQWYLVRHGETMWSRRLRLQGATDVILSPEGLRQSSLARQRLQDVPFTAIFASTLHRAMLTARIIAEPHGVPIQVVPELREVNFGEFEGMTVSLARERNPESWRKWISRSSDAAALGMAPPKGESTLQMGERVASFLNTLKERPDERMLIVAHAWVLSAVICLAMDLGLGHRWQFPMAPASISVLEKRDTFFRMIHFNDIAHLKEAPAPG